MGEPVKIVDLARDMVRLAGHSLDEIAIVFTGLRPGEKLYEEPLADAEQSLPTPHPKLRIAKVRSPQHAALHDELEQWLVEAPETDAPAVRLRLKRWVPEYAGVEASEPVVRAEPLGEARQA